MRILLAVGGSAARFALCTLLEQRPGWLVVGEVSSADQLPRKIDDEKPDVILVDWDLPELKVPDLFQALHQQYPQMSIIVLSGRPEFRKKAFAAGADAFVSKVDPPDRLLDAISSISENTQ